ncbi:hypothetical protein OF83DRAFT_1094151 [Amylostereum chailletii]|nr:hypothetical protein OF83DRAFT_1094151 [Amylostereum chailletii]
MAQASPSTPVTSPSLPPTMIRKPRTIILCFDGTSNQYGEENTNVIKFHSLLKKDKVDEQICYYQPGIGTYFQPGVVSPLLHWWATVWDEAVAWYLPEHVMDGYKFLMQNYNAGDKVCLFGFSRGAYTARALAGMIHKVGLLSKDNEQQIPFAYNLYKSESASDQPLARGFKLTFCREVPIEFMGVWDTVASVGVIMTRTLPFVSTNTTIRTFRHALSLDEHRAKFRPSFYTRPFPIGSPQTPSRTQTFAGKFKTGLAKLSPKARRKEELNSVVQSVLAREKQTGEQRSIDEPFVTDVKEVWFVGCHSDVGGGAVPDTDQYALADIPLRWMVKEVMQAQCGVLFEDAAFQRWNIPLSSLSNIFQPVGGPKQRSINEYVALHHKGDGKSKAGSAEERANSETSESGREAIDVMQPINDPLKSQPLWWLLEIIPTRYSYQSPETNQWVSKLSFHLGRGRYVPPNPKFHDSVKLRIDQTEMDYTPRARYQAGTETYVS